MAKFIFEMPDEMAAFVEAFRIQRGHKATAVALRELIAMGGGLAGVQDAHITVKKPVPKVNLSTSKKPKGRFTIDKVRPEIEYGALAKKPKGKAP